MHNFHKKTQIVPVTFFIQVSGNHATSPVVFDKHGLSVIVNKSYPLINGSQALLLTIEVTKGDVLSINVCHPCKFPEN